MRTSQFPVVTDTVPPALSADSQEICRSVMESSESSESKSDLGLGIIDTDCPFCVAGSDWWANYKKLLEDIGLNTRSMKLVKLIDTNLVMVVHSSLRSE